MFLLAVITADVILIGFDAALTADVISIVLDVIFNFSLNVDVAVFFLEMSSL